MKFRQVGVKEAVLRHTEGLIGSEEREQSGAMPMSWETGVRVIN